MFYCRNISKKTSAARHPGTRNFTRYNVFLLLIIFLTSCDPVDTIYIEKTDGKPVRCNNAANTRYEVAYPVMHPENKHKQMYRVRARFTLDPKGGSLSTSPARVSADILAGSMRTGRVPWIQFRIFCGESLKPYLVTPEITYKDLRKAGKSRYLYYVR